LDKKGIIQKMPGPRGHWNLLQVIPAYIKYKIGGRVESSRAKLTDQQERKLKIANDKAEGKLIETSDASGVFSEYASAFRAGATALPGRVATQLAGIKNPTEVRRILNDEIDDLLVTAEAQLGGFLSYGEADSVRGSGNGNSKANSKKVSRSVGRRKSSSTKRKRRAR
jgi:hypothetical protein